MKSMMIRGALLFIVPVVATTCECFSNPKCQRPEMSIEKQVDLKINDSFKWLQDKETFSNDDIAMFNTKIDEIIAFIKQHQNDIGDEKTVDAYIETCESAAELVSYLQEYMTNPTEEVASMLRNWTDMETYGWFIESIMDRQTEQRFKFNPEE